MYKGYILENIDQNTVNSLFDVSERSDTNAFLMVSTLHQDGYNLDHIMNRREENDTENHHSAVYINPVNLYIHSIFHNAKKTATYLHDNTSQSHSYDLTTHHQDRVFSAYISDTLSTPIVFAKANDIIFALLSDHTDAFKNLLEINPKGVQERINLKCAEPFSTCELSRGNPALLLKPLDIAVLKYASIQYENALKQKAKDKICQMVAGKLEAESEEIQSHIENLPEGAKVGILPRLSFPSNFEEKIKEIDPNKGNIFKLLDLGATGSLNAYFPVSDDAISDPFFQGDSFEQMSLQNFCEENQSLFEPDVLNVLLNQDRRPSPEIG